MDDESHGSVKLAVHVAETGHYFELNCPISMSIHILQTCIASTVHVNPPDQLLLCAHIRLEPTRTLASYRLEGDLQNVFLFNRVRLVAEAPLPSPEQISIKELSVPSLPSTSFRSHPLGDVGDPLAYVLPPYETKFRHHYQKGCAILACSRDKFELCRRLFREQQVQSLALDAARNNMNHFYKIIEQNRADFEKRFNVQNKQHAGALKNFDQNLERLRACKLHPSLVSKDRSTLLDCLDELGLRKQAEACAKSHKQFQAKVLQLITTHAELHHSVQELLNTEPTVDLQRMEHLVAENGHTMEEQLVILQSLNKDMDMVKKVADDYVNRRSSGSLGPHDAIAALGPMYDVHEKNHVPKMEAFHQKLERLLEFSRTNKHEMSVCVHTCMQRVAILQSRLRDVRNELSAFSEALNRQGDLFSDLKQVCRVGPAYRACLSEVVRRKASMKLHMGQAGQLAEKMAKKREMEIVRRDGFLHTHSALLPRDLLVSMGLFGTPSQCVVNIEPYDTNLLDLDMEDMEKYAPEAVFAPNLKASMTSNPLYHGDGHVHSEDSAEANSNIDVIEDMSDEISGTTKLEVENAWLKAEYASAIALLCSIDFDFEAHTSNEGDESQQNDGSCAAKRTIEALGLKDEHAKHLQSMLNASESKCNSYKQRVRELEQRLCDEYDRIHGPPPDKCRGSADEEEVSGITSEARVLHTEPAFELMDEAINCAFSIDCRKQGISDDNKAAGMLEAGDESMGDCFVGSATNETLGDEGIAGGQVEPTIQTSLEKETTLAIGNFEGTKDEQLVCLQATCAAAEERLEFTQGELSCLREELHEKTAILNECYMNCAELESKLLLAREEARTHQCLANRKAAEYSSLRASSVKLRGLVERLRHCVLTSHSGLLESLQMFANSLNSDSTDDVTEEFGRCVTILASRVGQLMQKQSTPAQSASGINNNVRG